MKKYIAFYTNGRAESWGLVIYARNWKEARRDAVRYGRQEGDTLFSLRLSK